MLAHAVRFPAATGLANRLRVCTFHRSRQVQTCRAFASEVRLENQQRLIGAALKQTLGIYFAKTPSASRIATTLAKKQRQLLDDHVAFRTFGVDGFGIASLKVALEDLGFQAHESFEFPSKHLTATWFSPPQRCYDKLPRVFVSELKLHEMSPELQQIVRSYTDEAAGGPLTAWTSVLTHALPWRMPTSADYHRLLQESEYAAWTLVNGYALNHTALSVHRMDELKLDLQAFADMLIKDGFPMNQAGGVIKVSPDGDLLQCSTLADTLQYTFADGKVEDIAGAYMEFVWRRPLPEFAHLPQATEWQRRDGFEAGNADKIFESTTLASDKARRS